MAGQLSPGVRWRELDYSSYVAALATTIVAILGAADKGPVNVPTLITNAGELARTFGAPVRDDYGLLAAKKYLEAGQQLYYIRVVDGDEAKATAVFSIGADDVFVTNALTEGAWANDTYRCRLSSGSSTGLYDFAVERITGTGLNDYVTAERWQNVTFDEDDLTNFIELVLSKGRGTERPSALVSLDVVWDYAGMGADPVFTPGSTGITETLTGGDSGRAALSAADYIGIDDGLNRTGLKTLSNPEEIDINLVAAPGVTDPAVVAAILTLCSESRRDCFGIIDSPYGLGGQDVMDWHNGAGAYSGQGALNTSYGALYWPWCEVYDEDLADRVFLPPSALVLKRISQSDQETAVWFAPAGLKRGLLPTVLKLETNPSEGTRDLLYSGGNAINPIMKDPQNGFVIWGQRTLLRQPSSLDRIKVRRTLLFLEKAIATAVRYLVFDPNDETTWRAFRQLVTPVFEAVKASRGISEYEVLCDETTNPPISRDRKEMNGLFKIRPTNDAEFITIDFALFSQGASFTS